MRDAECLGCPLIHKQQERFPQKVNDSILMWLMGPRAEVRNARPGQLFKNIAFHYLHRERKYSCFSYILKV